MPDTYARGWTTSPESGEVSKVRALQGKKEVAGIMYENIMAYLERVIDGLYENTPWLLEESSKGGKSSRKLNLFGARGGRDDSDAEEVSRPKHGDNYGRRGDSDKKKQDYSGEITQKVREDQKSYGECPFCNGYHNSSNHLASLETAESFDMFLLDIIEVHCN